MKREQKSFDAYTWMLGALAVVMLAVFAYAMNNSGQTADIAETASEEYLAAVDDRLRPFGDHYMPGEETSANMPQVAEAPEPEPVETALSGPQVFNEACLVCHGTGIGGAPMLTDAANWAPRIAQGLDTLRLHALEGFTGSAGYMPPKGARLDLSDAEIHGAVDYMLDQVPQ